MNKELLKGLTKEQIAKVKQCKNHEELLALSPAALFQISEIISIHMIVQDAVVIILKTKVPIISAKAVVTKSKITIKQTCIIEC